MVHIYVQVALYVSLHFHSQYIYMFLNYIEYNCHLSRNCIILEFKNIVNIMQQINIVL